MIVADTDVLIDFLHGRNPGASRVEEELRLGRLVTTVVAAFELWSGARGKRPSASIAAVLAAVEVWPLEPPAAQEAAQCRRELEARGIAIGMADCLVAGICISRHATLLTRNTRHFGRLSRLSLALPGPGESTT